MNRTAGRIEGIGGWLVLVALGVIASPFIQLYGLVEVAEGYRLLLANEQTSWAFTALVSAEVFGNGVFLVWACFNIYLFFSKNSAFKNSFVGYLIFSFLFVIADLAAADFIADLPVTASEFGQSAKQLIAAIIWSSYMYRSERVRNTFVRGGDDTKAQKILAVSSIFLSVLCVIGIYLFAKFNPPVITEQMLKAEAQNVTELYGGQLVDDFTRLDGVDATGMTFTYRYTLIDGMASEWDINQFVVSMRPNLLDNTCSDLGNWLDAGVTIQYKYAGNDGLPMATLDFNNNDCPELVQQVSDSGAKVSPRDIATNAKSSFVSIRGYIGGEIAANGSGFIVREDGVLVTNLHVLQGVEALQVELPNGEIYERVFVLGVDESRDLALLQVPATGLSALRIGDDRAVEVGDTIYSLGNPLGYEQTFTDGILSARRVIDGIERLQISAPISPGSSGGPVLNDSGQVIGVVTSFVPDGQNLNIAMPSHYVSGMLAVSNKSESFEELAGSGAFATSSTVAGRNLEIASILASFPEEIRSSFRELQPWRQQAGIRGLVMGSALEEDGWQEIERDVEWGTLQSGEYDSFELTLEAGEYSVFAVCDNDCTDLDIGVEVEGAEPLTDIESDAEPIVRFDLSKGSAVVVHAAMESCATEDCAFWVRLYRKQ